MLNRNFWLVVILLSLATITLAGCGATPPVEAKEEPAIVAKGDIDGINKVTLTERAEARLDIKTEPIREEQVNGAVRKIAPYASIIYDVNGGAWLYVNTAPRTYQRASITIDFIEGDMAVLTAGPDVGTMVATVGVPELYGTDTGVGK